MRGTEEDKKTKERYSYLLCRCGVKLHIDTYKCWKCEQQPKYQAYSSTNPNDAIYCKKLNSVEHCMQCYAVTYLNKEPCEQIFCFAKGGGDCELCGRLEPTRHECCQKIIKTEDGSIEDLHKTLMDLLNKKTVNLSPSIKPVAEQQQFYDDIPF